MIGYINGLIIDKNKKFLLVLTQGIGYKVFVTNELISSTNLDEKTQLFIHTTVKEDDISLYGFRAKEELTFFEQLLSVSGIGPKMALDILSTPMNITQNAIINGDTGMLTQIKGLGKKTAERLILELKNKITPISMSGKTATSSAFNEDVVLALESLGYEKFQIFKALAKLPKDITETEEIIKYFFKHGA